jgi:hypothetical protein
MFYSLTFNKLYYTRIYLATNFGSVKNHLQATDKNYKNGKSVCYTKEIPLYIVDTL